MNPLRLKILDQILSHMDSSQGGELKRLLEEKKNPLATSPDKSSDTLPELPDELKDLKEKPKGIQVEKVSVIAKPKNSAVDDKVDDAIAESEAEKDPLKKSKLLPGEEEMTDDELEELVGKYLKG